MFHCWQCWYHSLISDSKCGVVDAVAVVVVVVIVVDVADVVVCGAAAVVGHV